MCAAVIEEKNEKTKQKMSHSALQARRVGVAIRAMAHHKRLAQTVELIELLCVMLRGYFAECASVPHTFLERHLPEYKRHLASGTEEELEEGGGDEMEQEEAMEEDLAPTILTHLIRKLAEGSTMSEVSKAIHTPYGEVPPITARGSRGRRRSLYGGKRTVPVSESEEVEERSRSATGAQATTTRSSTPRPPKVAKTALRRFPPRAFRTSAEEIVDTFKEAVPVTDGRDEDQPTDSEQLSATIFKTASKKKLKKVRDMPVLTE